MLGGQGKRQVLDDAGVDDVEVDDDDVAFPTVVANADCFRCIFVLF